MSNYIIISASEFLLRAVISASEGGLAAPERLPPLAGGEMFYIPCAPSPVQSQPS